MCQKLQHFRANSEYLEKINTKKKINFFFQCLPLPKDSQSFGILITMLYKRLIQLVTWGVKNKSCPNELKKKFCNVIIP